MSETREELIARRDALIEQLQGEWRTRHSFVYPLYTALHFTKLMLMVFGGFIFATAAIAVVANLLLGNDMSHVSVPSVLLLVVSFLASFTGMTLVLTFLVCLWSERTRSIYVQGALLSLRGRKDSEVSLEHLSHYWKPHDEYSDRADRRASLTPQWVGHWLELWELGRYWLYPIKIRPMAYERGHDLVQLLDQLATVNDEIAKRKL